MNQTSDDFDTVFSEQDAARLEAEQREQAQTRLFALGHSLMSEFSDAEKARVLFELRWIDDLMQYRGQYPEDVRVRLKHSTASQVFYRMTTKVDTMVARLMDLLFPARSKNWNITATPDPMIPEAVIMEAVRPELEAKTAASMQETMQGLQAQGIVPDELAVQKLQAQAQQQVLFEVDMNAVRRKIATERAKAMETVIDDQLKEAPAGGSNGGMNRPSWQQNCKSVIHSASLYGMGVLKEPLVEKRSTARMAPVAGEDGSTAWEAQNAETSLAPYHEAVSLWNVYPDPGALTPRELRFVWQVHLKTDKEVWDLSTFQLRL